MEMTTTLLLDYRGLDPNTYVGNVLDPIIKRLSRFSKLQILTYGTENITYAEQQEKDANWQGVVGSWGYQNQVNAEVLPYDPRGFSASGPCEVWFKNMWLVFEKKDVDGLLYFPYDITYIVSTNQGRCQTLQAFIDQFNGGTVDLLLGTYEASTDVVEARQRNIENCFLVETTKAITQWNAGGKRRRTDIPKNFLEDFTVLELCSAFPKSMKWFSQQRSDSEHKPKPRTGFFGLSRRLFEEFASRPYRSTMMPWAGTVQLLICAAVRTLEGKKTFQVDERFISGLEEPPLSFDDYRVAHQRERITYVITDERHYWTRLLPQVTL